MKTYGWSRRFTVLALALVASASSAAITPITSVTCDHPPGSPPYHLQSITVGNYTVGALRLGTGTSTTTLNPANGVALPVLDDREIGVQYSGGEPTEVYTVRKFGGQPLWSNSNGDDPDFFLFEAGDGDPAVLAAILPGGQLGKTITLPDNWGGDTGFDAPSNGQNIVGIAFAITDLLDANGQRLTNSSTIEGLAVTSRAGLDPSEWCAVLPPIVVATNPSPADKVAEVRREAVLSWKPADSAKTHDVYLGTVLDGVTNAGRANPLGVLVRQAQDANTYDPPGSLALGQTYYWRIDEVEASGTIHKGTVWSFATEALGYPVKNVTATASSFQAGMGPEKTLDGSGLTGDLHGVEPTTMWMSAGAQPNWIQYQFDKVYKLHQLLVWNSNQLIESFLGFGAKKVTVETSTDGTTWKALANVPEFSRASGAPGYAANTTVNFGGVVAKFVKLTITTNWGGVAPQTGLAEVRFLYVPVSAREPSPAPGATGVNPQEALRWRAGREAASHSVYVSTDQQAVVNGTVPGAKVSEPRFEAALDLGRSYYWKVVETNEAETPKSWDGDVWTFTTADALLIDDFESYNDDLKAKTTIFDTWVDGYAEGFKSNGSTVGNDTARNGTFGETQIVHGGKQSMPMSYNNAAPVTVSEATRTFDTPQDWTRNGIATLVLYFYGDPSNAAGQVYVKINGTKVLYSGNANALKIPYWTQWNINLASTGANLKAVTKIAVGVEGSGKGIVYVDDIRLYRAAPAAAKEFLWIEAESGIITKPMAVSDDPTASGGRYISAPNLGVTALHTEGFATYSFTVQGGTYKIWGRAVDLPAGRNSFWVRIKGATLNTVPDADGWCNWNFPTTPVWRWDDMSNGTNSLTDPAVLFTLKPGTYTLEIAYREDGARLDALVITDATN